ncbi:MAG: ribonuclease E inhibitor RraB [Opitutae bacterium]|nr:ribonuclease E inhibitor RraB [Opitutae bacterium]
MMLNISDIPDDENGAVLRRMLENGDDLTKPRMVDFNHVFKDEKDARLFSDAVKEMRIGEPEVAWEEEDHQWNVIVCIFMKPEHAPITSIEKRLDTIASDFHGHADGWGCMEVQ